VKAGATALEVSCKVATCVTRVEFSISSQAKKIVNHRVKIITTTTQIGAASTSVASGQVKSIVIHLNAGGVAALATSRGHRLSVTTNVSVLHGATTVSKMTLFS